MRVADYASAAADIGPVATRSTRAVGPDLMRAIAILMVMLWHLAKPARVGALAEVSSWSWLGVDVFFVLSGYLIGGQLMARLAQGRGIDFADFYLRRAFRILPAFLAILALYLLVPTMREGKAMLPAWRFLTFSMNWNLDAKLTGTFSSAWSLCVEEYFYLLAPLAVLALRGRAKWIGLAVAGAILIGGMALRAGLYGTVSKAPWNLYMAKLYYPTWVRLDGLLLGVLLAAGRTFRPQTLARWLPAWAALLGGLVVLASALVVIGDQGPRMTFVGSVFGYPLFSSRWPAPCCCRPLWTPSRGCRASPCLVSPAWRRCPTASTWFTSPSTRSIRPGSVPEPCRAGRPWRFTPARSWRRPWRCTTRSSDRS